MSAILTEGGAADTLSISGTVTGDIMTNTGDDTLNIMGSVSGSNIRTDAGADTVTLTATSTTIGVALDLGEGDDRLNLASAAFGTLDGGADADTLSISGTGITLDGGAHSGFETLTFAAGAGSNTLSGAHVGLTVTNFNAGTTILTGSLASTTAVVASGAALDLAAGSSLSGDLSNSGMLTVAGSGFGSATITGDLVLNADGTLTLDTAGMGNANDRLMVSGAVTLGGTLMLRQTTMPAGMVILIDGGTSLTGDFASSNEMSTEGLVNGLLISQELVRDTTNFDLQLVTTVLVFDSAFPTGCTVAPVSPLADGGTLTCISETPITEAIATTVDGVTIVIGESDQQTTVMNASGDGLSASIASTSAAGNITINSEFGIISGGANGIVASSAGTGSISITAAATTGSGTNADGIVATLDNSNAAGNLSITATGAVSGSRHGISAIQNGSGTLTIDASTAGAIGGTEEGDVGILATSDGTGAISVMNAGTGGTGSRSISIISSGVVSGAAGGIATTHTGDGAITITAVSVIGQAGDAISATTAGGDITISGAHTVLGTGGRGIEAISGGGDISIQGVGETGGVRGSAEDGIYADASGGTGGNINIGDMTAIGNVTGGGTENRGINAQTDGTDSSITIDTSSGTVMSDGLGSTVIAATNAGTGGISITTADVTATSSGSGGIFAQISDAGAASAILIDSSAGTVSGLGAGISVVNAGSGTTTITTASVTGGNSGIFTRTTAGASITVNAGATLSTSGRFAIQASAPSGDMTSTPSDRVTIRGSVSGGNISTLTGADTVTLAVGSTTTGITVDLGEGDDRLDLVSTAFGTLDGGLGADTLSISATGITLNGGAVSGFETLAFTAGSNTLSGTHTGLTSSRIETGAILDLAAGSSLTGDLANSGMLTVAGSGFGSVTIAGDLELNAGGTVSLDTNGAGGETDLLTVSWSGHRWWHIGAHGKRQCRTGRLFSSTARASAEPSPPPPDW